MNLYLIRHGKTEANLRHLYCGSTDLPLSSQGREELKAMNYPRLSGKFVTSGMVRTEQTLELLFGQVPHTRDPRFREVNFGVFEMQSYEQLKDRTDYQTWLTGDNEGNVPPGGESGAQMTRRVADALKEYLEKDEDLILITHGGVIAAIMAELFPGEGKCRYQWQSQPGQGYAISDGHYRSIP